MIMPSKAACHGNFITKNSQDYRSLYQNFKLHGYSAIFAYIQFIYVHIRCSCFLISYCITAMNTDTNQVSNITTPQPQHQTATTRPAVSTAALAAATVLHFSQSSHNAVT